MVSIYRMHLLHLLWVIGLAIILPSRVMALDNQTPSQPASVVMGENSATSTLLTAPSAVSSGAAQPTITPTLAKPVIATDPLALQQLVERLNQDMTAQRGSLEQQRGSLQTFSDALALLETKFQEASKRLDDGTKGISTTQENLDKLREELLALSRDVRANASDISSQKSLIEDNSVRLYEILLRISTLAERLDQLSTSLKQANSMGTGSPTESALEQGLTHLWLMIAIILGFLAPIALLLMAKRFNTQVVMGDIKHHQAALLVCAVGFLGFFLVGFGLMYGQSSQGLIGISSYVFTNPSQVKDTQVSVPFGSFVLYQTTFILFAVMLVYRIVGMQLSLLKHLLLAPLVSMLLIPVFSHWVWAGHFDPNNKGWLEEVGFIDQAGAVTIHMVTAWFALLLTWKLGNNFVEEFTEQDYYAPTYSSQASLLMWLAALGFVVGSLASSREQLDLALVNISLAGAMGAVATFSYYRLFHRNPSELIYVTNGFIAGLVAIVAGAQLVGHLEALVIGGVAGLLQPVGVSWLRRVFLKQAWQIPAAHLIAIHGIGGLWGAVAVGIFGVEGNFSSINMPQFIVQLQGIAAALSYSIVAGGIVALLFKSRKSQKPINSLSVN